MVVQDCGSDVANAIARRLVLYARRPGYQSQFSPLLDPGGEPVRRPDRLDAEQSRPAAARSRACHPGWRRAASSSGCFRSGCSASHRVAACACSPRADGRCVAREAEVDTGRVRGSVSPPAWDRARLGARRAPSRQGGASAAEGHRKRPRRRGSRARKLASACRSDGAVVTAPNPRREHATVAAACPNARRRNQPTRSDGPSSP